MKYSEHKQKLNSFTSIDGEIRYIDQGNGPVILLIHGVPTSSWLYRNIIPVLVNNGYRVIVPDLLGFGSSEKPNGYSIYSKEKQAKRLLDLMNYLAITHWIHVCHDAGGLWTWELLKLNPSAVRKLILLNTIIYAKGFHPPIRFSKGIIAKIYTNLYKSKWLGQMVIKATLSNGLGNKIKLTKEVIDGYVHPLAKNGNRGIYYFFTQTCKELPDYSDLLPSLDVPVMVIWGAKDKILVWSDQAEVVITALNIKANNIHVLKEGGHFIQEEYPDFIAEKIIQFDQ